MNKTKIIENGVYSEDGRTLVGFIGNPEELVIVPGTFRIAREACSYCKTLKRVVIPPSLEFMNANCFKYCTSLSEVVFMRGSKLRFIENEVFLGCSSLQEIILPDSLLGIGHHAFHGCDLQSIRIPALVDEIGPYCFSMNKNLRRVVFDVDSELQYSQNGWFCNCDLSDSIVWPKTIKNFSKNICSNTHLRSLDVPNTVVSFDMDAFMGCSDLIFVNIAKKSQLKTISSYCFSDCNLLEHIELPEGLNYIEEFAFRNSGLISVTIPSSVKVLGMDCFNRCYALKEVAITIGSQLDCVGPFCWSECPSLRTFICEQKTFELFPVNLREFLEKKGVYISGNEEEEIVPLCSNIESDMDQLEKELFGDLIDTTAA